MKHVIVDITHTSHQKTPSWIQWQEQTIYILGDYL